MYSHRDVVARINLDALLHNVTVLRSQCQPGVRLCAALKGNAYGHGVQIVAPVLAATPIRMAAVATLGEAIELRELGWNKPILLFGPIFADGEPARRNERLRAVLDHDLTVTAVDFYGVRDLADLARQRDKVIRCHIKIDSGMGRMGISPGGAVQLAERLHTIDNLKIEGVYTHFASADESDKTFCHEQLAAFKQALARLREAGVRPWLVHAAATSALLDVPESHFDMVRPGIGLYGLYPSDQVGNRPDLRPVLEVASRVVLVKRIKAGQAVGYGQTWRADRDSVIGIVPIGYHDGYLRSLSNRAVMTVRDCHAPVVGRISMDQTVLDLTDVPGAAVGDEVIVIDDDPAAPNSAAALARILGTIPYEVTSLLGSRVARVACTSDAPEEDSDLADLLADTSLLGQVLFTGDVDSTLTDPFEIPAALSPGDDSVSAPGDTPSRRLAAPTFREVIANLRRNRADEPVGR